MFGEGFVPGYGVLRQKSRHTVSFEGGRRALTNERLCETSSSPIGGLILRT
jgi:hypothetical protein